MMREWSAIFMLCCGSVLSCAQAAAQPIPRTILALYNSENEETIFATRIHHVAEMPLNYLGLVVQYQDISAPLPQLSEMAHVRGILTWFASDTMRDPQQFLRWAAAAVDKGKKIVVFGDLSVGRNFQKRRTPLRPINHFLRKLGVRSEGEWTPVTYDARFVHKVPEMVEFERPLMGVLPAFERYQLIDPEAMSYLTVRRGGDPSTDSHLVVTNNNGGFAAPGYVIYQNEDAQKAQLYLNIFEFFRTAFDTDRLPKPDATTLAGRRIYYSHIDGDGWRNESDIEEYRQRKAYSSEVILEKVLKAYPDLPATVAPIAGDIDPAWYGTPKFLEIARTIFALPHIEAGSHTYSHPLHWNFFVDGTFAEERELLRRAGDQEEKAQVSEHMQGHEIPRSYVQQPFSLEREVLGSMDYIKSTLPPGKRVEVYQWSGDTLPFAEAVAAAKAAGVGNINGGDTRLDGQYPSLAWVAPLGRRVGDHWQIYASNSNENTYTDLFTGKYFGYRDLVKTLENTERPRRLKPINIYYHMYSGERAASLRALVGNLEYVRRQEIAPVTTSHYTAIADGFYGTRIVKLGDRSWRIENRGDLQTLRFDAADSLEVDLRRSRGALGRRHHQGSLYVSLDASVSRPVITLGTAGEMSEQSQPFLVQSRWHIWNLKRTPGEISFFAHGFGEGDMAWRMPAVGMYRVKLSRGAMALHNLEAETGQDRILSLSLPPLAVRPLTVRIALVESHP
jgi:hypothetical protein